MLHKTFNIRVIVRQFIPKNKLVFLGIKWSQEE